MRELRSKPALIAKAVAFAVLALATAALLLAETPKLSTAVLLAICVWASARLYYFAFYVIEHYIDPTFRYSGVFAAIAFLFRDRRRGV